LSTLFRSPSPRRSCLRGPGIGLLLLACLAALLLPPAPAGTAAPPSSACATLDREKWLWHSWYEDFIPPFFETSDPSRALPDATFSACWACGLWTNEAWPLSWNPATLREPMAFQKAECYRAVGMKEAALEAYRALLQTYPEGENTGRCIDTVIDILFQDGNLQEVVAFYERLAPDLQSLASPESLYLLGQSCYRLDRDEPAAAFLEQVPPTAGAYPLALYTRVQIDYRNGRIEQAIEGLRTLSRPEETPGASRVLRDQAQLTLARILFQQEAYEEAAGVYRTLGRSRFLLPEALMGMAWCYEAMGRTAGAISYFQAAEEAASRDLLVSAEARLEQGRLYAESGVHEDAFRLFRETQEQTREYIAFLRERNRDPVWLAAQAARLLPVEKRRPAASETPPPPASGPPEQPAPALSLPLPEETVSGNPAFQEEIDAVLKKDSYISPRMRQLNGFRDALIQIQSLLDRDPSRPADDRIRRGMSTRPYPPLETREALLDPASVHLLDVAFALLDAEYRLDNLAAFLGLTDPEERKRVHEDLQAFYRVALRDLILSPSPEDRDAYRTLSRLMTAVRHLPGSIEDREQIVKKLIYTRQTLQAAEEGLQGWERTLEGAENGSFRNPRPLLDRLWMLYVRTLLQVRGWKDRSPGVYLLPQVGGPVTDEATQTDRLAAGSAQIETRIQVLWERLAGCFQKEIQERNDRRLGSLEQLLTRSELYYAEALLKHQKSLLEELQTLPPEPEDEEAPEAAVPDEASPESPAGEAGGSPE